MTRAAMRTRTSTARVGLLAMVIAPALVIAAAARVDAQEAAPDASGPVDFARRTITVEHDPTEAAHDARNLDRLASSTLLLIEAAGFDHDTTGAIVQCTIGQARRCRNYLPVRFDDRGEATFQYLIDDDGGGCRLVDDRCTIELTTGERTTVIDAVFVDAALPPGVITVSPADDLQPGDRVEVVATGFSAGSQLVATVCITPATSGPRCGAPAPEVRFDADDDGAGRAVLDLDVDEVGEERGACGRGSGSRCQVVVAQVIGTGRPRLSASPVALHFAAAPGASYDTTRLVAGTAAALALLLAAGWLIARGDWAPPEESDGSAIDDAEFADLDFEAERHEAEDDEARGNRVGL